MNNDAFTLCAEAFAVVGLSDVIVRSIVALVEFASKVKGASAAIRSRLAELRGLSAALAERDCQKEILSITRALASFQAASSSTVARWRAGASYVRLEDEIRASVEKLSHYSETLVILIASRIGLDTIIIRREQAASAQVLTDIRSGVDKQIQELITIQSGAQTQKQAIGDLRQAIDDGATSINTRLENLHHHHMSSASTELAAVRKVDHTVNSINDRVVELTGRIASLTLTNVDDCQVLAEGDNLESAIGALQILNKGVASTLSKLPPDGAHVPHSNIDWFTAEMHKMLRFTYRAASTAPSPVAPVPGNVDYGHLDFDITRQISTVPVREFGSWREEDGFMSVEYVEGTDISGHKVRRFRFACFSTHCTSSFSSVIGLISQTDRASLRLGEETVSSRISRQLRVYNIRSYEESKSFRAIMDGNITELQHLLSTGQASLLDCTIKGWTLIGLAAHFGQSNVFMFLVDAGADPLTAAIDPALSTNTMIWYSAAKKLEQSSYLDVKIVKSITEFAEMLSIATHQDAHEFGASSSVFMRIWFGLQSLSTVNKRKGFDLLWSFQSTRKALVEYLAIPLRLNKACEFMMSELISQDFLGRHPRWTDEVNLTTLHLLCDGPALVWYRMHESAREDGHEYNWKAVYRASLGLEEHCSLDQNINRADTMAFIVQPDFDKIAGADALEAQGMTPVLLFFFLVTVRTHYPVHPSLEGLLYRHGVLKQQTTAYGSHVILPIAGNFPHGKAIRIGTAESSKILDNLVHNWKSIDLVRYFISGLLQAGADPYLVDSFQQTAFGIASDTDSFALYDNTLTQLLERHGPASRRNHDHPEGSFAEFSWVFDEGRVAP